MNMKLICEVEKKEVHSIGPLIGNRILYQADPGAFQSRICVIGPLRVNHNSMFHVETSQAHKNLAISEMSKLELT